MKKILGLLGVISVVSSGSSMVVSCNDVSSFEYYADSIQSKIETEGVQIKAGDDGTYTAVDMQTYFSNGTHNLIKDLDYTTLEKAVENAVESVVKGSEVKKEDNTKSYEYIWSVYEGDTKITEGTINKNTAFTIHLEANKDSKKWQGSCDIKFIADNSTNDGGQK